VLAGPRVRCAGEAVAVVVAADRYVAEDAAAAVLVEVLPAAATPAQALAANAPRVHEDWPDNLAGTSRSAVGDVDAAWSGAEVVVGARLAYPRLAGMPIEPRGVAAAVDVTGLLTVWTSTQVPFAVRSGIAAALGMPEERVRVIAPDVGGGFGVKGHAYPEDILIPAVARRLGRPGKWTETRREHLLAAAHDRDRCTTRGSACAARARSSRWRPGSRAITAPTRRSATRSR
jgi:carbon-monoxide dehydrogenase large subunit